MSGKPLTLIYDGDCPVCSAYVRFVRLRESVGEVRLINARDGGAEVEALKRQSIDFDEGMVLLYDDRIYHGSDCIHMLALLSTNSGWFNRFNAAIFKSERASRLLYPVLRAGRNLLLRLLGKSKIHL